MKLSHHIGPRKVNAAKELKMEMPKMLTVISAAHFKIRPLK